jgi:hypothetical protein
MSQMDVFIQHYMSIDSIKSKIFCIKKKKKVIT